MLALRLARGGRPLVQLRRLLVAAASAGTGFLLLCTLGYAMSHPDASAAGALRLAWCVAPLAATVYFAVAVARTDPNTRPRPGLSAIGLGAGRLMAISALGTALSTLLGSLLALLLFLHLRGDLTGIPFDGAAAAFLAADQSLPLPAALTLLALVPVAACGAAALTLRPRDRAPRRTTWSYGRTWMAARQSAFAIAPARGTRTDGQTDGQHTDDGAGTADAPDGAAADTAREARRQPGLPAPAPAQQASVPQASDADTPDGPDFHWTVEAYADGDGFRETGAGLPLRVGAQERSAAVAQGSAGTPAPYEGHEAHQAHEGAWTSETDRDRHRGAEAGTRRLPPPEAAPNGLPWGAAALAAGLAVETYASRSGPAPELALPGGFVGGPAGVLLGWVLTAVGLALAGPAIAHLCGRLLQAVRPGALRLLAGRVLQAEARRIGQPLGVVCAVASGGFAMTTLYTGARPAFGPLTTLGTLLVAGCTLLTLATAALEAKQERADTTAALLRLGAPSTMLRGAAALRVGALFAAFAPLTWVVAELAAMPLAH
ncbi:hypothetical protein [Streptomyces sp. NPDC002580]|uniref:hypothetical protein n=1 Tax=Streptomyces sp. NPDC002580 TaxID=3364653 RepID=UPI0036AC81ED